MPRKTVKSGNRKKHHVILIRHCVRSTKTNVKLYTTDSKTTNPVSDFTASPLPNWNVPADWCTKEALKVIKRSGNYLMNNILYNKIDNNKHGDRRIKLHFDVVADTAYRDVDTALSLSLGIKEVLNDLHDRIEATGIDNLRYDPVLFKPLEGTQDLGHVIDRPFCTSSFSQKERANQIFKRLQSLPKPSIDLNKTISMLEERGGVGRTGSMRSLSSTYEFELYHDGNIKGSINAVKLIAQMMFYSRAGGIDPPFIPEATVDEVYIALAWAHYARSVVSMDNVKVALKGAILADTVIRSLQGENDQTYDEKVTILVGHDTNMDSLATAMGLRWNMPLPFHQSGHGEFMATPPGSIMYFVHDKESSDLKMSYLFPIMVTDDSQTGKSYHLNNTGILESIPMIFREGVKEAKNYDFSKDHATSTITSSEFDKTVVDVLRERTVAVLSAYPEASECFSSIIKLENSMNTVSRRDQGVLQFNMDTYFLAGLFCISLFVFYVRHRSKKLFTYSKVEIDDGGINA